VVFHNFIWAFEQPSLFKPDSGNLTIKCNRDTILNARDVDWLEWQAGYASGAFFNAIVFNQRNRASNQ